MEVAQSAQAGRFTGACYICKYVVGVIILQVLIGLSNGIPRMACMPTGSFVRLPSIYHDLSSPSSQLTPVRRYDTTLMASLSMTPDLANRNGIALHYTTTCSFNYISKSLIGIRGLRAYLAQI